MCVGVAVGVGVAVAVGVGVAVAVGVGVAVAVGVGVGVAVAVGVGVAVAVGVGVGVAVAVTVGVGVGVGVVVGVAVGVGVGVSGGSTGGSLTMLMNCAEVAVLLSGSTSVKPSGELTVTLATTYSFSVLGCLPRSHLAPVWTKESGSIVHPEKQVSNPELSS